MAMRSVADVILVGAGTVRQEKYGPVRLEPDVVERRRERGQTQQPQLAIVTNRGVLDPSAKVFSGPQPPLVLTTTAAVDSHPELQGRADIVACGDQWVELGVVIRELHRRGLLRVLCEGGPTLLRSLIEAGSAETSWPDPAGVPGRLGGHHTLLGDQPLTQTVNLTLSTIIQGEGVILTRYHRVRS